MEEALGFFKNNEIWIYMLLGLGGLFYVRKFFLAFNDLRGATFGLERESAQARLNMAASIIILILALVGVEFILVTFLVPGVPGVFSLLTPTLNLLVTPTTTLQSVNFNPEATQTVASSQTAIQGCIPGQIAITSPADGSQIQGMIDISGSANIPNFGFYKLEMKRPEELNWLTILAGNAIQQDNILGSWNTSLLTAGIYQLSLVVSDNQGNSIPRCVIQLSIANPVGTAQP